MSDTCRNGHPRTPENLWRNGIKDGKQQYACRICQAEQHKRTYVPHPHIRNGPRPGATPADEPFLHWLAGFIDGEGTFYIRRNPAGNYHCSFRLTVRDDDNAIMEEIRDRVGIGTIQWVPKRTANNGNPQTCWSVNAKAECLRLVDVLDAHPLRAKKSRDYAIWRTAVMDWATAQKSQHHDWTIVANCNVALKEVRTYRQPLNVRR